LRSLSRPTDPVISRSGMPSLSASSWPDRPPPLIIMCSRCLTHFAPEKKIKGVHAFYHTANAPPLIWFAFFPLAVHFFTLPSYLTFMRGVKIRKLFVFLDSLHGLDNKQGRQSISLRAFFNASLILWLYSYSYI